MSLNVNQNPFSAAISVFDGLSILESQVTEAQCPSASDVPSNARESVMAIMGNLVPNIREALAGLSDYNTPLHSMNQSDQLTFRLKVTKPVFHALELLSEIEGISDSEKKQLSMQMQQCIKNFSSVSTEVVLSSSAHVQEWLEEIVSIQEIFSKHLEATRVLKGDSKGVLYEMQKEGKTYGYLFGTFHYAFTPELQEATLLSPAIYKKLCQCAILGTEMKVSSAQAQGSVEGRLLSVAEQRAIVNFGIDTPLRDKMVSHSKKQVSAEEGQIILQYASRIAKAYKDGNREALAEAPPKEMAKIPPILAALRNKVMAENIDAILTVATQVRNIATPKSFFAIGGSHLFENGNVRERLTQMGWDVVAVD